jgi:hypothetical protein
MNELKSSEENEKNISKDNEEEEEEDESIFIEIKKEKPEMVYIPNKIYKQLISQLNNANEMIKIMKQKTFQSKNISEYEINNNNNNKNKEIEIIDNDILEKKEQIINQLNNENEKFKKEIISLKSVNSNLEKKYEELKDKYEKELQEKNEKIISMQKEIDDLTQKYKALNDKALFDKKNYDKIIITEKIFNNDKIIEAITNFLPMEDSLKVFSLNKKIHFYFKYKNKTLKLQKQYLEAQNLLEAITSKNILSKYEIDDEELQNIINKYTNSHIITGNPLRVSVCHALTFLEHIVRRPIQEKYNEDFEKDNNKEKIKVKAKGLFNDILSAVGKNDENEITNIVKKQKIKESLDRKMITMDYDNNMTNIKKIDEEFKTKINKDQLINIKFEFDSAEQIKNLIKFFLKIGLAEDYYIKFRQYLINEFSELLYNCNSCLKCIKELEICNKIQGIRFSKNIYLIKQMANEIGDLKLLNESNKKTKEKLLKQKNELEAKYNDSLIKNSSLNQKVGENEKKIVDLIEEKNKIQKEMDIFKKKTFNDYKQIENKYNVVNNERNSLINIFLEMKLFFIDKIETFNK